MSTTLQAPTPTPPTTSTSSSGATPSSGVQFKRTMAGEGFDAQERMLAPVQMKGGEDTGAVHDAATRGIQGGGGALPFAAQIQKSFGAHDVGQIKAHTGSAAKEASKAMGAEAYATGDHVAFGGAPDLHTAAHEAAHVVQQQAGVALSGGVGKAGDGYEQHADKVADRVVKGESAEGLLSEMTGGAPKGQATQRRAIQRRDAVQRTGEGETTTASTETTSAETTASGDAATPTVTPLTTEESRTYARQVEVGFGAAAASSGEALNGAQAMVDGALRIVQTYVDLWNQRLTAAQATGARVEERVKTVEAEAAKAMGTPPTNRAGHSNASIAGAVAPGRVMAHLREGTGNLRTKMTAAFNFMTSLSTTVLAEKRSGDDAFFTRLDAQGAVLQQAATDAEVRIAEQRRRATERGQDPSRVRDTILAPAASAEARQQEHDRAARPGIENTATVGTTEDPFRSQRRADDASIGPALHTDEQSFMGLDPSQLGQQCLTWREGLDLYVMSEDNAWVQMTTRLGLPAGAGPASGTTDRLMQTGTHLGCGALGTRAATIGYLMSINAHTLNEIMTSAKPYGFAEPIDGFEMYREISPFGSLERFDTSPEKRFWNEKVMGNAPIAAASASGASGGTGG